MDLTRVHIFPDVPDDRLVLLPRDVALCGDVVPEGYVQPPITGWCYACRIVHAAERVARVEAGRIGVLHLDTLG